MSFVPCLHRATAAAQLSIRSRMVDEELTKASHCFVFYSVV